MRKFEIIAKVTDNKNNLDEGAIVNETATFKYEGNKRSTEKSIIKNFKSDMRFLGVTVHEIISFKEY